MSQEAYKVLKEDLTNVGLLNAPQIQYVFGRWIRPREPLSSHARKGGGLWVAPTLSVARQYVRYLRKKHGITARVFKCRIGKILYRSSCRIKTDKLFFTKADEIKI